MCVRGSASFWATLDRQSFEPFAADLLQCRYIAIRSAKRRKVSTMGAADEAAKGVADLKVRLLLL